MCDIIDQTLNLRYTFTKIIKGDIVLQFPLFKSTLFGFNSPSSDSIHLLHKFLYSAFSEKLARRRIYVQPDQYRSQPFCGGRQKNFPKVEENYTLSKGPPLVDVCQKFLLVFTYHLNRFFAFSAILDLQNDVILAWRESPKAKFGCFLRHSRTILRRRGGH